MFEERALMFLYAISPVHMGAGQAIGVVDNPIQREKHTNYPIFAGSGIKGSLRDVFQARLGSDLTRKIFGPETNASYHAGAVSFSDAQILLFPVRSLRESYAYVTCPTALARLKRAAQLSAINLPWAVPEVEKDDHCLVVPAQTRLLTPASPGNVQRVILETFEFAAHPSQQVTEISTWISREALPDGDGFVYFRNKISKDLVVLSDTRFKYYVENATIVEPHVRISDESGTADDGGLFYTENVPPEALFFATAMSSLERVKKGENPEKRMSSSEILRKLVEVLNNNVIQIGGDATTGRGLVTLRFVNRQEGGVS